RVFFRLCVSICWLFSFFICLFFFARFPPRTPQLCAKTVGMRCELLVWNEMECLRATYKNNSPNTVRTVKLAVNRDTTRATLHRRFISANAFVCLYFYVDILLCRCHRKQRQHLISSTSFR